MQHHMPMEKLVLEVTETAIMKQPDIAIKVLVILDSFGAKISLDDFGTGHSSFLYLKHFPVREIKIDKSFICELTTNTHERSIVRSTIQLAHDIGARVVAEGVENKETQTILTELDCDYIQGYYVSTPLEINEMIDWLKGNKEIHNDATIKVLAFGENLQNSNK
jgi:EAL domain-containing protein (putative c-di-GMP-specific phosphodiesterase class I)